MFISKLNGCAALLPVLGLATLSHAAILVDFVGQRDQSGNLTQTPATATDFTHAGISEDLTGSTVTVIDIGPQSTFGPFSGSGYTITSSDQAFSFPGGVSGNNGNPVYDQVITQNPANITQLSGLSTALLNHEQYKFYLLTGPLFGPVTETGLITYGAQTSAPILINTATAIPFTFVTDGTDSLTIATASPGQYTAYGAFAFIDLGPAAPEPATLGVLGLGALAMLARRRKA